MKLFFLFLILLVACSQPIGEECNNNTDCDCLHDKAVSGVSRFYAQLEQTCLLRQELEGRK